MADILAANSGLCPKPVLRLGQPADVANDQLCRVAAGYGGLADVYFPGVDL
jgi:hypothetical protein